MTEFDHIDDDCCTSSERILKNYSETFSNEEIESFLSITFISNYFDLAMVPTLTI